MRISKRSIGLAGLLALIAAAMLAFAVTAVGAKGPKGPSGGQGNGWIIRATLAPSLPTDPVLNGVSPGNAPWVLQRGEVRLKADGTFNLRLRGLVIPNPPGDGTPGPVTTVQASLYCGGGSTAAATTQQVPISRAGDARIRATLSLPSTCLAPVILVHPNGLAGIYISAEGWRS